MGASPTNPHIHNITNDINNSKYIHKEKNNTKEKTKKNQIKWMEIVSV